MIHEADVLIIGAGPAGLSAGIVFAQHSLKTYVFEQKALPVDKACGEGVMPTGVANLERLGVLRHLSPQDYYPFRGIRYVSRKNLTAEGSFREGPGWGIPRLALSSAFTRRAEELPKLKIIPSVRAVPVALNHDRVIVLVEDRLFSTRLLIGADGLNSKVRRWAGLEGAPGGLLRWGTRMHFSISPWSDWVEIHWGEGAEGYVTPCGKELVSVTILWDRQCYRNLEGGPKLFPSLLAAFPKLEKKLNGSVPFDLPKSIGPMQRSVTSPVGEGVLLIGDAAGYLDALTGEGISLATAQALALETNVVPLLKTNSQHLSVLSRHQLDGYSRAYQEIIRPYNRMTRLALKLNHHPRLAEWAIWFLSRQSGFFQYVLSANMGTLRWNLRERPVIREISRLS